MAPDAYPPSACVRHRMAELSATEPGWRQRGGSAAAGRGGGTRSGRPRRRRGCRSPARRRRGSPRPRARRGPRRWSGTTRACRPRGRRPAGQSSAGHGSGRVGRAAHDLGRGRARGPPAASAGRGRRAPRRTRWCSPVTAKSSASVRGRRLGPVGVVGAVEDDQRDRAATTSKRPGARPRRTPPATTLGVEGASEEGLHRRQRAAPRCRPGGRRAAAGTPRRRRRSACAGRAGGRRRRAGSRRSRSPRRAATARAAGVG